MFIRACALFRLYIYVRLVALPVVETTDILSDQPRLPILLVQAARLPKFSFPLRAEPKPLCIMV